MEAMATNEMSPLEFRRLKALESGLTTAGLYGSDHSPVWYLDRSGVNTVTPTFRDTATAQQKTQANGVISGWDWSEAAELPARRADAVTQAALSADATAIGTRSLASVAATRDNNLAEVLSVVCEHIGLTPEMLVSAVAARRQTSPPPNGAPSPADVVTSATTRLDGPTVFGLIAGYIQAGVGDPMPQG